MILAGSLVKVRDAWNTGQPHELGILKEVAYKGHHRGMYEVILTDGSTVLRNEFEVEVVSGPAPR